LRIGVELVDSSGQHRVIDLDRIESVILASVIVELALPREFVRRRSARYSTQLSMTHRWIRNYSQLRNGR
jgi:hypothetical protein